ncbi:Zinc-regulated transporter 3 [Spathaspora sp. JA1]|nr:Zinc-regulated transporter 3 [Spathaspora sp. JA1]
MFELPTNQGWTLTTLASLICVSGTLVIFFDDIYYFIAPKSLTRKYPFNLNKNYKFMNGCLAFSSGCLIFTSLYRLLPEALSYLEDTGSEEVTSTTATTARSSHLELIGSYIAGILICLTFNSILHMLTSESVVHCNHGGDVSTHHDHEHGEIEEEEEDEIEDDSHLASGSSSSHGSRHNCKIDDDNRIHHTCSQNVQAQTQVTINAEMGERTPLIKRASTKQLIMKYIYRSEEDGTDGECKGYSSAELCTYNNCLGGPDCIKLHYCEIPELPVYPENFVLSQQDRDEDQEARGRSTNTRSTSMNRRSTIDSHHSHNVDHHHHVVSPLSRLLLIGIETVLAITLHKLPEGFITYITSETNPELGLTIFISLLFHNFTEGFSMCLPLYYSFSSSSQNNRTAKWKAVSISAILGGLSQPVGALLGFLFLKFNEDKFSGGDGIDVGKLNYIFGITLSITSGFLTVIALSMYGSAVSFGGSSNFVMLWCLVGICLIGLSSAFT